MSAPIDIPINAVALFRLPLSVPQITAMCDAFPIGHLISQIGEWIVITRKEERP